MVSNKTCSRIERKPRAPVFFLHALRAIACNAASRNSMVDPFHFK